MKKNILRAIALGLMTVILCVLLSSCSSLSDPDKTAQSLESAGYAVVYNNGEGETNAAALPQGSIATIMAYNGNEFIYITYYEDIAAAEDAWGAAQSAAEALKKNNENVVYKKSGNIIYYGTKQALKDAK